MLRPPFELARIIIVQYSFVYIVQMQKRKKERKTRNRKKHKHCAMKEQIPPFRIAFQKLNEC